MDKNKYIWNHPLNLNNQAASNSRKCYVLRMLVHSFLCNVNNTRALIGLCLIVTSKWGQIRDPGLHCSAHSNWSLAIYPLFYSSNILQLFRNNCNVSYFVKIWERINLSNWWNWRILLSIKKRNKMIHTFLIHSYGFLFWHFQSNSSE